MTEARALREDCPPRGPRETPIRWAKVSRLFFQIMKQPILGPSWRHPASLLLARAGSPRLPGELPGSVLGPPRGGPCYFTARGDSWQVGPRPSWSQPPAFAEPRTSCLHIPCGCHPGGSPLAFKTSAGQPPSTRFHPDGRGIRRRGFLTPQSPVRQPCGPSSRHPDTERHSAGDIQNPAGFKQLDSPNHRWV